MSQMPVPGHQVTQGCVSGPAGHNDTPAVPTAAQGCSEVRTKLKALSFGECCPVCHDGYLATSVIGRFERDDHLIRVELWDVTPAEVCCCIALRLYSAGKAESR